MKRQPSRFNLQGITLQNIQIAHRVQYKNKQIKIWAENLDRHFSKEDKQMAKRHMKRCSISLIFREMQLKTTMRYYLIPFKLGIIKKSKSNKCWRECGEKGTFLYHQWEYKLIQPLWRIVWCSESLSHVQLFVTPWSLAHQALLFMESLQAGILEWVAMPSSRGSSQLRDRTQVSCTGRFFNF